MSDIDVADKDRRVRPCFAPCGEIQPESGKHKPCESKEPFGDGFRTLLRKSAGGTKISRRKPRGCTASPRRLTADGNADRIRLCGTFESQTENRLLGVAALKNSLV